MSFCSLIQDLFIPGLLTALSLPAAEQKMLISTKKSKRHGKRHEKVM